MKPRPVRGRSVPKGRVISALGVVACAVLIGCAGPGERRASSHDSVAVSGPVDTESAAVGPYRQPSRQLPELDSTVLLPDYLAYAALNNPGLEAAFSRWKAAVERATAADALPDPRLSYGFFIQEVETRVGPQRQKLGISQAFPWFGSLDLAEKGALEKARVFYEQYSSRKLALFREVKEAAFEWAYLLRAIAITAENIELLASLESVARARYKVGGAPYASVIKAQVELGKLEDRLQSLKDLRAPRAARFNAVLGRSLEVTLHGLDSLPEDPIVFDEEALADRLLRHNPELRALDHAAAAAQIDIDLADRDSYPDFTLGLDYIQTEGAPMPVHDSGKDPLIATISVNLPFFSSKYTAAERAAEWRYQAALRQRMDRANILAADLKMALFAFRDAERKIELYRHTLLPRADQSLEVTSQAFETGQAGFLDLIDAQRVLIDFRLSLERALADRAIAVARVESLVGDGLENSQENSQEPGKEPES